MKVSNFQLSCCGYYNKVLETYAITKKSPVCDGNKSTFLTLTVETKFKPLGLQNFQKHLFQNDPLSKMLRVGNFFACLQFICAPKFRVETKARWKPDPEDILRFSKISVFLNELFFFLKNGPRSDHFSYLYTEGLWLGGEWGTTCS